MKKLLSLPASIISLLLASSPVHAVITNNAVKGATGADPAGGFATYFGQVWKAVVLVGGIAFLVYLVMGGLDRIFAGGDKAKLESANKRITNALIGLVLLVGSFAVAMFVSEILNIDLLNITWPTP